MRHKSKRRNIVDAMAEHIFSRLYKYFNMAELKLYFRSMNVLTEQQLEYKCKMYYLNIIKKIVYISSISVFLLACTFISSHNSDKEIEIYRNGYGEDSKEIGLTADIDGKKHDFYVEIIPLEYMESDMDKIFEQGFEHLDSVYLGNNVSYDEIKTDLNLISYIDELGLSVRWFSNDYDIIDSNGKLTDEMPTKPCKTSLIAEISYNDYSRKKEYPVTVVGHAVTYEEAAISEIRKYIADFQQKKCNEQTLKLPSVINGHEIQYADKKNTPAVILMLVIAFSVILLIKSRADLRNNIKIRNDVLMRQYPEFVDKLSLYMRAGLSVRAALYMISENMSNKTENESKPKTINKNILAEEIKFTLNEIFSGSSEAQAYSSLGHRLKLPVYLKLTSLLSQNIKKGTKDVLDMLADEEASALALKQEIIKKKGEEASTKLLFPMIVLLVVVMIIVMLPALMSF